MKKSWLYIGLLTAVILAASFASANWTTGFAGTIPTLPTLPTIPRALAVAPSFIRVDAPAANLTVSGKNFIDTTDTVLRWLGPDNQYIDLAATTVTSTSLTVVVPAELLTKLGDCYLWVVNHPSNPNTLEIAGPLEVPITNVIFVPSVKK